MKDATIAKIFIALLAVAVCIVLLMVGVGIWGFVTLVQAVTG